jgi:AraC family transcriptional regulator
MPIIARGRIVVWEGASLWMLRGETAPADIRPHAHHAIQITFLLQGAIEIRANNDCCTGPVVAVRSDVAHSFWGRGAVAHLFIAPESAAGRALLAGPLCNDPVVALTSPLAMAALTDLRACYDTGTAEDAILHTGQRLVRNLGASAHPSLSDTRVLAMMRFAQKNLDETVTLPAAARHVCLSQSPSRHLFVEQTGLPFKTYVLWLRLERAVALSARGYSLTQASHEAGFADSAHFSRTYRRTFGLSAAMLRLDASFA